MTKPGAKPLWAATFPTGPSHWAAAAASSHGLVATTWRHHCPAAAQAPIEALLAPLVRRGIFLPAGWIEAQEGLPPHLAAVRAALGRYDAGERGALAWLALDLRGRPAFFGATWRWVQSIPAGEVRTYGQVAAAVGRPGAARAVGQAMSRNPLAPVVPCHRVLAAGGLPGGFGPGLDRKRELLAGEGYDLAVPDFYKMRVDITETPSL